jgi:hypothetical protein
LSLLSRLKSLSAAVASAIGWEFGGESVTVLAVLEAFPKIHTILPLSPMPHEPSVNITQNRRLFSHRSFPTFFHFFYCRRLSLPRQIRHVRQTLFSVLNQPFTAGRRV